MKQSRLLAILSAFIASPMLSSCTSEPPPPIESPAKWQAHLVEAKLPADFSPAVSERVYVPIYSQIYIEDAQRTLLLAGTLSIRNTDEHESIIIKSINYYDTEGHLIQSLIEKPVSVGPFATGEVVVPRTHTAGGSGANFVVDWMASSAVTEPIIEAIMVSTGAAQTVSFSSRGQTIMHTTTPATQAKKSSK